jgi:hypothetical protein
VLPASALRPSGLSRSLGSPPAHSIARASSSYRNAFTSAFTKCSAMLGATLAIALSAASAIRAIFLW